MISFSLAGFGVVMFVLIVLSTLTSIVGLFFKGASNIKAAAKPVQAKPAENSIPKEHEYVISAAVAAMMPELKEDGGQLIAVLSAAASAALSEEAVVVSFKEVVPDMSFAREGRQEIYASKNYIPSK